MAKVGVLCLGGEGKKKREYQMTEPFSVFAVFEERIKDTVALRRQRRRRVAGWIVNLRY